ncbi:MAG: hypothetical protein WDM81_10840 [Rhizomicrobium sp.]
MPRPIAPEPSQPALPPPPSGFSRFGPRLHSLAGRLIAAAAVWTVLALAGGGVILSNAFRTSVQGDFDSGCNPTWIR